MTVPGRLLLLGKEELVHVAETSQLEPEPVFLLGAAVAFVLLLLVPVKSREVVYVGGSFVRGLEVD